MKKSLAFISASFMVGSLLGANVELDTKDQQTNPSVLQLLQEQSGEKTDNETSVPEEAESNEECGEECVETK